MEKSNRHLLVRVMMEVEFDGYKRWVYVYLSKFLYDALRNEITKLNACDGKNEKLDLLIKFKDDLFSKCSVYQYVICGYFDFQNINIDNDDLFFLIEKEYERVKQILSVLGELVNIGYAEKIHYKKAGEKMLLCLENYMLGYEKVLKLIDDFKMRYNALNL